MTNFYTYSKAYGNYVLHRGYKDGRQIIEKAEFKPSFFIASKSKTPKWKSLAGEPLDRIQLSSINEAKDFRKKYEDVHDFDIHGMEKYEYQFIAENYPGDIDYSLDQMNIWFIDLEVLDPEDPDAGFPNIQDANLPIVMCSIHDKTTNRSRVYGINEFNKTDKDDFEFIKCRDEKELLRNVIDYWEAHYPDLVSGWNTEGFDIPYFTNRISRVLGTDWLRKLSPFRVVRESTVEINGKDISAHDIYGVIFLDYMALYKKFGIRGQKESFSLSSVALDELGEDKLENPTNSFYSFYTDYYDQFVRYNAHDSKLVHKLDEKLKLISLVWAITFLVKSNASDILGTIRNWDCLIYNYLLEKNIAIPPAKHNESGEFAGAWVMEPVAGFHKWIMTYDWASLYPSIIRQWNMSPETMSPIRLDVSPEDIISESVEKFAEGLENDLTVAANGVTFTKDKKGIIPEMMEILVVNRKKVKNEMLRVEQEYQQTKEPQLKRKVSELDIKQDALKRIGNSGYGALAQKYFRYFDLRIAEAVTLTGQACNKHLMKKLDTHLNKILKTENHKYCIYGDTDSCVIRLGNLVDAVCKDKSEAQIVKFLDKFGSMELQKVINTAIDSIFNLCNCKEKIMSNKREAIASAGIFTSGKKSYALKVLNSEGVDYKPYKLKVTGLVMIKSQTPKVMRAWLKDALVRIFDNGEESMQEYVKECKEKFLEATTEEIAFPKGVSDIDKWFDKKIMFKSGCPIHVRASILYNMNIDTNKVQLIRNGDKIRFVYLKMPNPIKQNVFGFPADSELPKDLKLEKYVDRELQWQKGFVAPLETIAKAIGWEVEKTTNLAGFFG